MSIQFYLSTALSLSILISCTQKVEDSIEDSVPVASKSFEVSGVSLDYKSFTPYLCFQLVGGLFMVKNQYYSQKLEKAQRDKDKVRAARLVERTSKARVLMETKAKEIAQLRTDPSMPYEEQAQKTVGILVNAFETLQLFEGQIVSLCTQEAQAAKGKCYKMKNQSLFSKCYDEEGKKLNKKVLTYFNKEVAT